MLVLMFLLAIIRQLQGAPTTLIDDNTQFEGLVLRDRIIFGRRETSDIILSCLATIFACTWTAIHPNIPGPTDSGWTSLKRRVLTAACALLAPEAITAWALRQHYGAKNIAKFYNEGVAKKVPENRSLSESINEWWDGPALPPPLKEREIRPWTTTHGFFIQMGGFMLCENGRPVQTLPYFGEFGLKILIDKGVIEPPITTEAEIKDRSKGDAISKAIITLHIAWFVVQCIVRWSTRIFVTELEIVTLGFALLNGITCVLWWDKPQSVGVPVYLEMKKINDIERTEEQTVRSGDRLDPLGVPAQEYTETHEMNDRFPLTADVSNATPTTSPLIKKGYLKRKLRKDWKEDPSWWFWSFDILYRLTLTTLRPLSKLVDATQITIARGDLRVPMFYSIMAGGDTPVNTVDVFLSLIAVLFGCVHLAPSWFLVFPSVAEQWLWITCSIVITALPVLMFVLTVADLIFPLEDKSSVIHKVIYGSVAIPSFLAFPSYIFARIIIVLLAFLALRASPPDTFKEIQWTSLIPHLHL